MFHKEKSNSFSTDEHVTRSSTNKANWENLLGENAFAYLALNTKFKALRNKTTETLSLFFKKLVNEAVLEKYSL